MPSTKPFQFVFLFVLAINTLQISAQDYYLHFNAGYGLGIPGEGFSKTISDTSQYSWHKVRIGLGGGLQTSASFGFINRDNWGLDFQFYYQNQFKDSYNHELSNQFIEPDGSISWRTAYIKNIYTAWSIGFSPSLKITSDNNNVKPFVTVGPSIYYNFYTYKRVDEIMLESLEYIEEFEGRLSFGGIASIGVEFEISRDLYFTSSVRGSLGYIKPSKSKYIKRGELDMDSLPVSSIETEYVEERKMNEKSSPDKPRKDLSYTQDYSSVSLMLGLKWVLN